MLSEIPVDSHMLQAWFVSVTALWRVILSQGAAPCLDHVVAGTPT